ncbi:MAG: ABC transporter substrate-binding protein [Gammaproteobacteria bacterium RIFCSPHIGHO2_12_FULL_45_9]|nr:MAG: ABC transporter substrate-binding protein [Gammaproteobacteria bacterium RIFCSPHIGHO2_12_FULL_45_9]
MKRYMLDTNTISHFLKGHTKVTVRIVAVPMTSLCMSAITEGELLFGLAKRPEAKALHAAIRELLQRVDTLPWDSDAAECYGIVRAHLEKQGRILAPLDLLIAAHALATHSILVSNDQAFKHVQKLHLEDWTV